MILYITYKNHRNEEAKRKIQVQSIRYGTSEYYPRKQWLVFAIDLDRTVEREFALDRITYYDYPDGALNGPNINNVLLHILSQKFTAKEEEPNISCTSKCMVCDEDVNSSPYFNVLTRMSGHKSCIRYLPENYVELFNKSKTTLNELELLKIDHIRLTDLYNSLVPNEPKRTRNEEMIEKYSVGVTSLHISKDILKMNDVLDCAEKHKSDIPTYNFLIEYHNLISEGKLHE